MNIDKATRLEEALDRLPRVDLVSVRPTPLEALPRLSQALGGPPLYIKRDDLTGLALGGNKTRMFEFALADALAKGAEVIVSGAAVQSNYCRQLAAACARLGLELQLILRPVRDIDEREIQGNQLLQRLCGAQVTILKARDHASQQAALQARVDELAAQGRKVYWPRRDDTVDLDALAYAAAALEIAHQCRRDGLEPTHLYCSALDTTQAGLALGLAYVESSIKVRGFCPVQGQADRCRDMADMANQGARRLGLDISMAPEDFDNDDGFVGPRYGLPSPAGLEALRLLARTEGILLDPVYTSKAMAGLFADVRSGRLQGDGPVVFLHTGGNPALFAYAEEVLGQGA